MGWLIEQVFFVRGSCVRILTAFRIFLAEFAVGILAYSFFWRLCHRSDVFKLATMFLDDCRVSGLFEICFGKL